MRDGIYIKACPRCKGAVSVRYGFATCVHCGWDHAISLNGNGHTQAHALREPSGVTVRSKVSRHVWRCRMRVRRRSQATIPIVVTYVQDGHRAYVLRVQGWPIMLWLPNNTTRVRELCRMFAEDTGLALHHLQQWLEEEYRSVAYAKSKVYRRR